MNGNYDGEREAGVMMPLVLVMPSGFGILVRSWKLRPRNGPCPMLHRNPVRSEHFI